MSKLDFHVTITERQVLSDSACFTISAQTARQAGEMALGGVSKTYTKDGQRRILLRDGQCASLDPETTTHTEVTVAVRSMPRAELTDDLVQLQRPLAELGQTVFFEPTPSQVAALYETLAAALPNCTQAVSREIKPFIARLAAMAATNECVHHRRPTRQKTMVFEPG